MSVVRADPSPALLFLSESAVATLYLEMMMEISIFRLIYTVQKHLYLYQNGF